MFGAFFNFLYHYCMLHCDCFVAIPIELLAIVDSVILKCLLYLGYVGKVCSG